MLCCVLYLTEVTSTFHSSRITDACSRLAFMYNNRTHSRAVFSSLSTDKNRERDTQLFSTCQGVYGNVAGTNAQSVLYTRELSYLIEFHSLQRVDNASVLIEMKHIHITATRHVCCGVRRRCRARASARALVDTSLYSHTSVVQSLDCL